MDISKPVAEGEGSTCWPSRRGHKGLQGEEVLGQGWREAD